MVRGASLTFTYFPVSVLVVVYQLCPRLAFIELSTSPFIVSTTDAFHVKWIIRFDQGFGKAWYGISDIYGGGGGKPLGLGLHGPISKKIHG